MISKEDLKFAAFQAHKKASKKPIDPDFIQTESKPIESRKKKALRKRRERAKKVQDRTVQVVPPSKPGLINPNLIVFIAIWIIGFLYFFLKSP